MPSSLRKRKQEANDALDGGGAGTAETDTPPPSHTLPPDTLKQLHVGSQAAAAQASSAAAAAVTSPRASRAALRTQASPLSPAAARERGEGVSGGGGGGGVGDGWGGLKSSTISNKESTLTSPTTPSPPVAAAATAAAATAAASNRSSGVKDKGERSGVRGGTVTPPMPSGALSAGSISMRKLLRQAERGKGPYHEGGTGGAREEVGEKEGGAVERSLEKRGGGVGGDGGGVDPGRGGGGDRQRAAQKEGKSGGHVSGDAAAQASEGRTGQERRAIPAALMMEYDCDRRFLEFVHTQFDILRLVGSGTYGEVYECWDRVNKRTVALKRLTPGINNTLLDRSYEEEARIIKLLAGKQNVVNLVLSPPLAPEGHLVFEDESALVLTYLCHDPPKELLQHFKKDDIRCFMRQLLLALEQVHGAGVVHNDVKLSNILYERATGNCLLVDFGLASRRLVSHKASRFSSNGSFSASQASLKGKLASGHVGLKGLALKVKEPRRNGTKGFRAPEVVLGSERQCSPVDLWSAGVVMLCLLTRVQQFAWLTHQSDAKAAMEFRCLRAHLPQMDSVWVRADRRYSLKPVDKLLALIHKHRIKHTDFIEEVDIECKAFYDKAKSRPWTWRTLVHEIVTARVKTDQGWTWTKEEDPMWDLLNRLLDFDPDNRITAEEALQHNWFNTDLE